MAREERQRNKEEKKRKKKLDKKREKLVHHCEYPSFLLLKKAPKEEEKGMTKNDKQQRELPSTITMTTTDLFRPPNLPRRPPRFSPLEWPGTMTMAAAEETATLPSFESRAEE